MRIMGKYVMDSNLFHCTDYYSNYFWLKPHNTSIKNELFSDDKLTAQNSEQLISARQSEFEILSHFQVKVGQDIQINCKY